MKSLLTVFTLVFTVMFSSSSFAAWIKVGYGANGSEHYLDFERIREHNRFVYYWDMVDFLKPNKEGNLSSKAYHQGDCKLFRLKYLSISLHKEPMVGGAGKTFTYNDDVWEYPSPKSISEIKLNLVCMR